MSSKNWKLKEQAGAEIRQRIADSFSLVEHSLGVNTNLLTQLLFSRGIQTKKEILDFIEPKYENLHDPFLFVEMETAVKRIWQAIETGEGVCIYGDYDADAVTANAVLQQTFRHLGVKVQSYIPDRFTEGYGINTEALSKITASGVKVIITVDCGTNSVDAGEFCAANGIDLIITDHHEIIGPLPKSLALINPKNPADKYPYREITGVGVAFKLACAILKNPLAEKRNEKLKPGWEKWLLDLVAIGTVADCHSLMGENRILVKYGIKVLAKTKWIGLKALMQAAGLDGTKKTFDTYTLGFVVAPRLNAAGRLEHADIALHLLMEENEERAVVQAAALENVNRRRQDLTERVLSEAKEQAEFVKDRKVIVIMKEEWPKGIVGLVAGRIVEAFGKPAIVMEKGETEATGSARTVGEFDVVASLKHASEHLVRFGGHQQAAGLTLKVLEFEQFYQKVLDYAELNLTDADQKPALELETELQAEDLNLKTGELLALFEPFGVDNHRPKFLINDLTVVNLRLVGAASQHLQMRLRKNNIEVSSISFNLAGLAQTFKIGDNINVAAELLTDQWNGKKELKLRVIDIKSHSNI